MNFLDLLKTKTFWAAVAYGIVEVLESQGIISSAEAGAAKAIIVIFAGGAIRAAIAKSGPNGGHP